MCKEADEEKPYPGISAQSSLQNEIPDQSPPMEIPTNAVLPPDHAFETFPNIKIGATIEDLPLSDINEDNKAI